MNIYNIPFNFTNDDITAAIHIWNRTTVSLLDIRHNLISTKDPILHYRMPASTFVYAGGKAEISLNDTVYHIERFGLFHGGKGTELSLRPVDGWLEYYMVFYKTAEQSNRKKEYQRLLEQFNPFRQQYGFAPNNPIFFAEQLRTMHERWKNPTPANLFYSKSAFYRLVHEIYEEMEKGKVNIFEPDMIALAKRYLDEHYSEAVSIQTMREVLGISNSHFHRLFTARTGQSPQEYLIHRRLDATKKYLLNTNCTLREIAAKCGFSDELSLMRMFRKHVHMSTTEYRDICASKVGHLSIEKMQSFPYNEKGQVSLDELGGKGANDMFKQIRSKAAVAAMVSLMLLLSACSAAPKNVEGPEPVPTATVAMKEEQGEEKLAPKDTKIVNTIKGEVEIPKLPQRVVVMNYAFGDILALGVTPAAVNNYWAIEGSAVEDLLKDIPRASELEEVMSIEPDLIITAYEKEEDYEKLSKIAPTVSFGTAKETTQLTTEERLSFLSEVLGVEDGVKEKVLAEYAAHIEEAKQVLNDAGYKDKSFTFLTNSLDEPGIVVATYKGAQALYDDLGMLRSDKGQEIYEQGEWYAGLSLEVFPEYCGDYIILFGDGETNAFLGNGVYESIEVVKNGNVILMNEYLSTFNDLISVKSQIDFYVEALLGLKK